MSDRSRSLGAVVRWHYSAACFRRGAAPAMEAGIEPNDWNTPATFFFTCENCNEMGTVTIDNSPSIAES
jgi:hypothetical protein